MQRLARERLLKQIYAPLNAAGRGTLAQDRMKNSGDCWSKWHKPDDIDRFASLQEQSKHILVEIDRLKAVTPMASNMTVVTRIVDDYAHQSVKIEQNSLLLGDSRIIAENLEEKLLQKISLGTYTTADLKHVDMPATSKVLPGKPENDVVELRNHILISRWVAINALQSQGTLGLDPREIRDLQALMLHNTLSEQLYAHNWGPRTQPGDYRQIPISSKFNPLRVYPYHFEILSLMNQWQDWRVEHHRAGTLHPLILACQMTLWFLHIHPFSDGNGRVGRTIMQDYMMRQGYWPCLIQNLAREDYLTMVSHAQDGQAQAFVSRILTTQLEILMTLHHG